MGSSPIQVATFTYNLIINMYADLAHLVERDLAKVEVAGSSPVIRSIWRHSQAVRQRSAKPLRPSSNLGGASKMNNTPNLNHNSSIGVLFVFNNLYRKRLFTPFLIFFNRTAISGMLQNLCEI